jgi:hypothetical protein
MIISNPHGVANDKRRSAGIAGSEKPICAAPSEAAKRKSIAVEDRFNYIN